MKKRIPLPLQTMRAAIKLLREDAKVIFESSVVRAEDHPRFGKFDDDEIGQAEQRDYERHINAANELAVASSGIKYINPL